MASGHLREAASTRRFLTLLVLAMLASAGCVTRDTPAAPADRPDEDAPPAEREPAGSEPLEPADEQDPNASAPPGNGGSGQGAPHEPPPEGSEPRTRPEGIVIAVLDSGIHARHASFAEGQVAAWYDFTNGTPRDVALWDPLVAQPYDDHGHGSAVAAMAAGTPHAAVTPSHAPGAFLAVAKVLDQDNVLVERDALARAILWAVDVVRADVVTISIGSRGADLASDDAAIAALAHAREAGVPVFLSAGNGVRASAAGASATAPGPSWAQWPKLGVGMVVGGARADKLPVVPLVDGWSSTDAHVTALYHVVAPCVARDDCVTDWYGTSFATPLVAGMAATLLEVARASGNPLSPEEVERVLKRVAHDTPAPPNLEGYGFLDADSLAAAIAHVREGAPLPEQATPLNELYVDTVQPAARDAARG